MSECTHNSQVYLEEVIQRRNERIAELEAERDALREALERISDMCDVSGKCACGRQTGVAAVRQCAKTALLKGEQ